MRATAIFRFAFWIAETFGSAIAFYTCLHFWGIKTAVVVGILVGVAYVAREIVRDRRISPYTAFVAANVAVFGLLDLRYQSGFFLKLEPAFGNAATAVFFLGSLCAKRPLLVDLAERAAQRDLSRAHGYLRVLTGIWGLFFFVRAAAHVWLAYHVDLERALLLRALLGPLSFGAMIVLERPLRYMVFGKRAFGRDE